MKEKNLLSYAKGITRSPSDFLCSDGELAECINLEVKNEELVPMELPVKMDITLEEGETLVLVHHIKGVRKNYVTLKGGVLRCFYVTLSGKEYYSRFSATIGSVKSIQSLGNTIVAYSTDKPHYFLYTNGDYKYLGSSLPTIGLSFNLEGTMVVSKTFEVNTPSLKGDQDPDFGSDENIDSLTDQIIPQVNQFIADESEEKGLFIYPFLVRYAYKLFDGSYVMHSSPVLMMPSTTMAPICGYEARQDKRPPFKTFIAAVPSKLTFRKDDSSFKFGDWKDIISSVSIFISSQFRTYDQEGRVESITKTNASASNSSSFYGTLGATCKKHNIRESMNLSPNYPSSHVLWDLPQKDMTEVVTDISSCATFYKYVSYTPDELDGRYSFVIDPETAGINPIKNIEAGEVLADEYMSHDTLVPESSFVYNGRLNISNVKRFLFNGYSAAALSQPGTNGSNQGHYRVYTYVRTLGGDVIVRSPYANFTFDMYGVYLYYPDTDAYKMVIQDEYLNRYAVVALTEHSGLNGAFYFNGFNDLAFLSGNPNIQPTSGVYEQMTNKLMTSELNNPFCFTLSGVNTVGSGEIIGISAVTRPISQGQFGEYPLIAFCSDGNFAMKVDSYGFYSGISPVQEDLVLGGDKICSMENSVAVITKKGIMLTSGNDMTQIAPQMDGRTFDVGSLYDVESNDDSFQTIVNSVKETESFQSYLAGARMAFDYASDRLLIYHPGRAFFYVYQFSNGTISKGTFGGVGIVNAVQSYPDTILQDENGYLYSIYTKADVNELDRQFGMIVTRPLSLGNAVALKSIYDVKTLWSKHDPESVVKYALYGSNDNERYYKVLSKRGTPFKYYRLVLYSSLLASERISGSVLMVDERRTNKLR